MQKLVEIEGKKQSLKNVGQNDKKMKKKID